MIDWRQVPLPPDLKLGQKVAAVFPNGETNVVTIIGCRVHPTANFFFEDKTPGIEVEWPNGDKGVIHYHQVKEIH